ncbi:MAG: hypothetical protein KA227_11490, partial [Thermoanaerobaculia bacterium]|nr:hypothetical protein [Thermoanaerobaculia bacterium]
MSAFAPRPSARRACGLILRASWALLLVASLVTAASAEPPAIEPPAAAGETPPAAPPPPRVEFELHLPDVQGGGTVKGFAESLETDGPDR